MSSSAIDTSQTARTESETNVNDTSDGPTSWTLGTITCPTCGVILPTDTTTNPTVECPRCHEVTTVPTEVEEE